MVGGIRTRHAGVSSNKAAVRLDGSLVELDCPLNNIPSFCVPGFCNGFAKQVVLVGAEVFGWNLFDSGLVIRRQLGPNRFGNLLGDVALDVQEVFDG